MLIIGITGGIGCGKSTVCEMLAQMGVKIISADARAREISETNEDVRSQLRVHFGEDIFTSEGKLDRQKLGRIVFSDEKARQEINRIVHPQVLKEIETELAQYRNSGKWDIVVVEAALIYEAKAEDRFDYVVVISASEGNVIERLNKRGGLSRRDILNRIRSQMPLEQKVKKADYVVENNGSLEALEVEVKKLYHWLKKLNVKS